MAKHSYYALVFLYVCLLDLSRANKCAKESPCSCTIDEYSFISLSELRPAEELFFQDRQESVSYFFSGCEDKDFDPTKFQLIYKEPLKSVSLVKCNSTIIQGTPAPNTTVPPNTSWVNETCRALGNANNIKFDFVPGSTSQYQIIFQNNKTTNESLPSIQLACDNFKTTDLKILSSATDALVLYSPLVCVQHISHHELSTGSIFCVIFFVAAITYFVGGGLIMYTVRGARGAEVIPNFDFWVSIPGLIKDGMIFILSGCRPFTVSTAETYDRI